MSQRWPDLLRLLRREEGQDLAEYGLLGVLIAVVVILAVTLVGVRIEELYQSILAAFQGL